MTYSNWDIASNDALDRVTAYTGHVAGTAGYGSATYPSLTGVHSFLDDAYYEIGALLQSRGYAIAQTDDNVQGFLCALQAVTAAVKIELTQPAIGGRDNERYRALVEQKGRLETLIESRGLTEMGATKSSDFADHVHIGGISRSRKTSVESDTDLVKQRFRRGWGQHPGRTTGDAEADTYKETTS